MLTTILGLVLALAGFGLLLGFRDASEPGADEYYADPASFAKSFQLLQELDGKAWRWFAASILFFTIGFGLVVHKQSKPTTPSLTPTAVVMTRAPLPTAKPLPTRTATPTTTHTPTTMPTRTTTPSVSPTATPEPTQTPDPSKPVLACNGKWLNTEPIFVGGFATLFELCADGRNFAAHDINVPWAPFPSDRETIMTGNETIEFLMSNGELFVNGQPFTEWLAARGGR